MEGAGGLSRWAAGSTPLWFELIVLCDHLGVWSTDNLGVDQSLPVCSLSAVELGLLLRLSTSALQIYSVHPVLCKSLEPLDRSFRQEGKMSSE